MSSEGFGNYWDNKPNKEQLIEQRNKYIDEAISMAKVFDIRMMDARDIGQSLLEKAEDTIIGILKEKHGINENSSSEEIKQFYEEYDESALAERYKKYVDKYTLGIDQIIQKNASQKTNSKITSDDVLKTLKEIRGDEKSLDRSIKALIDFRLSEYYKEEEREQEKKKEI